MRDGAAEIDFKFAAGPQPVLHRRLKKPIGAAAFGLGAIKRGVGVFHQAVGMAAVHGADCNPDAGADKDLMAFDLEWLEGASVQQVSRILSGQRLYVRPSIHFVPFIYQLTSYLGQGATSPRNVHLGEGLFLTLPLTDANKSVKVTAPDGKSRAQNSTLGAQGVTFSYHATSQAGLYKVSVGGSNTTDAFSVRLATGESDLTPAEPGASAVAAGLPKSSLTVASTPTQMLASVNRSRYGVEIWNWLLWAVLPLLFLESLLAQRWGRRG